jgi:tRNA pseudouridine55 synthase
MYNGILNVYKEKDYTSHDVVAKLRGILKQKKIGHTGTLDPQATGVLPVCLGRGTKVAGMLTDKNKCYITTFKLGEETDTQDHTGEVIATKAVNVSEERILKVINDFIGPIAQIPPMYSAIKINGQKLYDLARAGIEVERKERHILISDITDVKIEIPYVTMTVYCSKGTYIRTLCRDISEALGTCGHMVALERIATGQFTKESALTLDEIKAAVLNDTINEKIIAVDQLFSGYETIIIDPSYNTLLDNGNKMPKESVGESINLVDAQHYNVYNVVEDYMGVYEWSDTQQYLIPVTFFCIRR